MLEQAESRFRGAGIKNIKTIQGDVGALPFEGESFDIVLCMNGLHVFPLSLLFWLIEMVEVRLKELLQFIPRNHILWLALTNQLRISTIVEVAMRGSWNDE